MPPRKLPTIVFLVGVLITTILFVSGVFHERVPALPEGAPLPVRFTGKIPAFKVPDFHFSFRTSAHKPPEQRNSTSGESAWYSDWKWLNPFSSAITLDENRSVLPPLVERPPIYTYHEKNSDREQQAVDKELLLTWQRAWWAQGFRPVVLSQAEALNNPLYQKLQGKGLPQALEFEFLRWLAWSHMGGGMLASWHCYPMAHYDDALLSHLRRGPYPQLTRFEGFGAGFFVGEKVQIDQAITDALLNLKLNNLKSIIEAVPTERFAVEEAGSIAFYDSSVIDSKYPILAKLMSDDPAKGRHALNDLIIAHLHTVWQNTFSSGIAVLKPLPQYMTTVIAPSLDLAKMLAQCPATMIQSSCPPNRPRCAPCVASRMQISTPETFMNVSTLYTIGTVPHPYTMVTLANQTDSISIRHIRRYTDRDPYLVTVTKGILGTGRGGPSRLIGLKNAIASDYAIGRSLWMTVEQLPASLNKAPPAPKLSNATPEPVKTSLPDEWLEDLDWHFGFPIPRQSITHGESIPPVPGPERWPKSLPGLPAEKKKGSDPDPPTDKQIVIEIELLGKAREVIKSKDKRIGRIKEVAQAWNLADTEAWKFVRAFRARSVVERRKWEEEEKAFGAGKGKGKGRWW